LLIISGSAISLTGCTSLIESDQDLQIESGDLTKTLVNTPVAFKEQSQLAESQIEEQVEIQEYETSLHKEEQSPVDLSNLDPDMSQITRVVIPRLGVDNTVVYTPFDGLTWKISDLGENIGWMENTSIPGLGSNTALSAHVTMNDGSNGPFKHLGELKPGDEVEVFTENSIYKYTVTGQDVVADTDFSIIEPTVVPKLTLITCTDWHVGLATYLSRLVVYSDLVEVQPLSQAVNSN
jgi:LPXTG-site transpeptidase (sortase) family protein